MASFIRTLNVPDNRTSQNAGAKIPADNMLRRWQGSERDPGRGSTPTSSEPNCICLAMGIEKRQLIERAKRFQCINSAEVRMFSIRRERSASCQKDLNATNRLNQRTYKPAYSPRQGKYRISSGNQNNACAPCACWEEWGFEGICK